MPFLGMEKERNDLKRNIEITFDNLISELSMFDEYSLNQVPFEGSWTAGQTAEHIIICGSGLPDTQTTEANRAHDEKVQAVKELFLNFDIKFETAPSIAPGSPPHDKQMLVNKIKEIKEILKTIADTKPLEELCLDMQLPTFGNLTRYEWLRFILFHTQRHTHQVSVIGKKTINT